MNYVSLMGIVILSLFLLYFYKERKYDKGKLIYTTKEPTITKQLKLNSFGIQALKNYSDKRYLTRSDFELR